MRIREDFDLDGLREYGFTNIKDSEEYEEEYVINGYEWLYEIGHGRRGQFYYLLIGGNGSISLYASDADGSGAPTVFPVIVFKMMSDGVIDIN